MDIHTLLLYIIASFILSIILQTLEKRKKDNFIDSIIISNLFILVLAGIFSTYHITKNNDNIFLIIFFQVLGNIFYHQCIQEISIWNHQNRIKRYLITLGIAYVLNIFFINQTQNVFPHIEGFKIILWMLIIIYLYFSLKNNLKEKLPQNRQTIFYQDKEYIVMQYAKFKSRYDKVVFSKYRQLIPLIYAIMIYENYYRPEILRKFDHYKYLLLKEKGKFGIMQVYSNREITDEESIKITIRKLEKIYQTLPQNKKYSRYMISNIVFRYYHRNMKAILEIYQVIISFQK